MPFPCFSDVSPMSHQGSYAVGGTIVCAGPASAPASRAAASAPASAASRISSSTVPNKSGLDKRLELLETSEGEVCEILLGSEDVYGFLGLLDDFLDD